MKYLASHPNALLLVCVLIILSGFMARATKAQKAERGTMQWSIPVQNWHGSNTIHVIDTSGVCLYIGWAGNESNPAIAAVPKTQLPQGVGCQ